MSVSTETRKAGPFSGDDLTSVFPFTFKAFSDADVYAVVLDTASGTETVLALTTDYTVALNADQNTNPGGELTLVAGALATGYQLTLSTSIAITQGARLTNQGGWYPQVVENALDKLTIISQQLQEQADRSIKLPISSTATAASLTADLIAVAALGDSLAAVADIDDEVAAVAAIDGEVAVVAANVADVTNFADVYQGPKAADPLTRNDGSALQIGDLYFNTVASLMQVYSATGWLDAQTPVPVTITAQTFSGDNSTVDFTLSDAPPFLNAVEVAISGIVQVPGTDYTLSGTTLSFTSAPPLGTDNVFVRWYSSYSGGVPNDGSVTSDKIGITSTDYFSSSVITGWASPTGSIYVMKIGGLVVVQFSLSGTSNATAVSFTVPYAAKTMPGAMYSGGALTLTYDNGAAKTSAGRMYIADATALVVCNIDAAGGAWTSSGAKEVQGTLVYLTA